MEIKESLKKLIIIALENLDFEIKDISLEHPADLKMGDYSTNVAMVLAKKNGVNPKDLAEKIVETLRQAQGEFPEIQEIQAKNGFINFYLSRKFFTESIEEILEKKESYGKNNLFSGRKIMVEYTDPNPFKPFHIGHLMTNAIGESVSRIVEFSGAKTIRANYQGDVGPHVAKAIYVLMQNPLPVIKGEGEGGGESISQIAQYIGECYAKGNDAYETDEKTKKEIEEINKKIYERSDERINEIYDWGKKITLEAFEEIYKVLGTNFNYYFFESIMAPIGEKIVRENISKTEGSESIRRIFEKSDGAIVFHAEKYDPKLHTRVFINSQGLPTYEAKELGLTKTKFEKENPDLSIVMTGKEQADYMRVVKKAIEQIDYEMSTKMVHITHGLMRLTSGKMSSRKGNVVTGESLLLDSCAQILEKIKDRDFKEEEKEKISKDVGVSALKYSILKQSIGGDIVYDKEKSISFEGDSGPYLQYSFARANSVLEKAKEIDIHPLPTIPLANGEGKGMDINFKEPTDIERLLCRFPEIVLRSAEEFAPHYMINYLVELARAFNAYYGSTKIIDKDDPASPYKLALVFAFAIVMKNGLYLLGIKAPERM